MHADSTDAVPPISLHYPWKRRLFAKTFLTPSFLPIIHPPWFSILNMILNLSIVHSYSVRFITYHHYATHPRTFASLIRILADSRLPSKPILFILI
jgi:hypothetical protein